MLTLEDEILSEEFWKSANIDKVIKNNVVCAIFWLTVYSVHVGDKY